MKMNKSAVLDPHHWYDPIVQAEHKAVDFLAEDVDHTVRDFDRFDRAIRKSMKRHPVAFASAKSLLFVVALFGLLASQLYHASRFP